MNPERWQKVKLILGEAVETPASSRSVYLHRACAGDDDLRREIESLLAFENTDDALEESAFADFIEEPDAGAAENFIGERVGNYEILEKLGEGGMGAVFLAKRVGVEFDQRVAVKIIRRGIGSSNAVRRRFFRERQILAKLEHPFIARLIDGGATQEDGQPYLVMEYIEGGAPVTDYARSKNLTVAERLDLFRQICQAVAYAHRNLIVHRDLKPSNILVAADGTPKLLDFGIAKLLTDERSLETQTHTLAFTPEYASPEQLRGETLTTATDIYSLGVILYELLTDARPFSFDGKNFGQILQIVTLTEPPPPSAVVNAERGVRNAELKTKNRKSKTIPHSAFRIPHSKDLDNIILKSLKKEPERRYSSVEQFSEDIRRHLKGLPVTARQDTWLYRAERFTRRNPLVVGAVALAFLILIGGIAAVAWQARIANLERARAERRFNDVRQLANSFVFEINEEIERSPIKARELLVTRALEYLDKLAREAEGDAELQSELAAAYEKIGNVQSELFNPALGRAAEALESHRKSLKIRENLFAANPSNPQRGLDAARSRNLVGDTLTTIGKQTEAVENYRESIRIHETLLAADAPNAPVRGGLSNAYAKLGQAILRSGSLSDALENYEKALAIRESLAAENSGDLQLQHQVGIIYSYIGYVKIEMNEPGAALDYFQKSLAIERRIYETDRNNRQFQNSMSIAHTWVGFALHELGEATDSIEHMETGLEFQQRVFGADQSNFSERNGLADSFLELGLALKKAKRFDEAIEKYERAIENFAAVSQADPQNLASRRQISFTRHRLADALLEKGETEKALKNYEQSLAAFQELTVRDPNNTEWQHDLALSRLRIGEIFLRKKDAAKAAANFETALPILERLVAQSPEHAKRGVDLETARRNLETVRR